MNIFDFPNMFVIFDMKKNISNSYIVSWNLHNVIHTSVVLCYDEIFVNLRPVYLLRVS